jgi:hypothetical protein
VEILLCCIQSWCIPAALAFLFEYVATLGVIDVAYIPPTGSRNDFHDRWGTDDFTCLSRYDGLMYLRINALGVPAGRRGR